MAEAKKSTTKPSASTKPAAKQVTAKPTTKKYNIVGLTTCPTGIAHTMMAAEAIEKWAKLNGHNVKVEKQAQIGTINELTQEDIDKADYVIIAAGKAIEKPERFNRHSKVLRVGVEEPIHKIDETMKRLLALDGTKQTANVTSSSTVAKPQKKQASKALQPLLAGISYMIPVVVLGGIFLGVSLAIAGDPTINGLVIDPIESGFWLSLNQVGGMAFSFMIPLLAMMIANAIAGRSAMAPAAVLALWANSNPAFFNYGNIGEFGDSAVTVMGVYFTPDTTIKDALEAIGTATLGFDVETAVAGNMVTIELGTAYIDGVTEVNVGYQITLTSAQLDMTLAEAITDTNEGFNLDFVMMDSAGAYVPATGNIYETTNTSGAPLADISFVDYYGVSEATFAMFGGFSHSVNQGFLGAIIIGYVMGLIIKAWNDTVHSPKWLAPVMPIIIIPLFFGFVGWAIMSFFGYVPLYGISLVLNQVVIFLTDSGLIILLGFVLGMMIGFDMGGPVNKLAFLFAVSTISTDTRYMGMVTAAVAVPPIGCAMGVGLGKAIGVNFDEEDQSAATSAGVMGIFGISEGAIPFAAKYPATVFAANMVGAGTAGLLCAAMGVTSIVAHGGPFIALIGGVGNLNVEGTLQNATTGAVPAGGMISSVWPAGILAIVALLVACVVHAMIFAFGELSIQNKKTRSKELAKLDKEIKASKNETLIAKSKALKDEMKASAKLGFAYDKAIASKAYYEGEELTAQMALDVANERNDAKAKARANNNINKAKQKANEFAKAIEANGKTYNAKVMELATKVEQFLADSSSTIRGVDIETIKKALIDQINFVNVKYGLVTESVVAKPVSKPVKAKA